MAGGLPEAVRHAARWLADAGRFGSYGEAVRLTPSPRGAPEWLKLDGTGMLPDDAFRREADAQGHAP